MEGVIVILNVQGMTGSVTCVCPSSVSIFVFSRENSAPTSARLRLRHVPLSRPYVLPFISSAVVRCLPELPAWRWCIPSFLMHIILVEN